MPIHVTIAINDDVLETVHIGRIEGDTRPESVNVYLAVAGKKPSSVQDWKERGEAFLHRYGEGAYACVMRALDVLINRRVLDGYPELRYKNMAANPDTPKGEARELKVDLSRGGHHCGYDFEIWKPTAVCECGAVATNPFYVRNRNDQI